MTEPIQLILCDRQPELVKEWRNSFQSHDVVVIRRGDLMDIDADAYVSPANSYGWMDGGIDLDLRDRFMASDIESKVQSAIAGVGGLLPVGEALIVATEDEDVPYLIVAPTMEIPAYVGLSNNAYKAMAALLNAIQRFNSEEDDSIETVAVPGLCTGIGGMEPRIAALQMHQAYIDWLDSCE